MTDIALDEKALAETQVEFDNVPPGLVEAIVAAWNRRSSPSQVAPQLQAGEPVAWRDVSIAPEVAKGDEGQFVVAVRRARTGKVHTFPAMFLHDYPIYFDGPCSSCPGEGKGCASENGDGCPMTGWYSCTEGGEYDYTYSRLHLDPGDEHVAWCDFPAYAPAPATPQPANPAQVTDAIRDCITLVENTIEDGSEHEHGDRELVRKAFAELAAIGAGGQAVAFQQRVQPWMMACFGPEISADKLERSDRLAEEVLELLQSGGYPRERVAALTDYVYGRDIGEPVQEVGGVMVTLAAYCLAHDLDMHECGEAELARIWTKVDKIRAKQAAKPTGSALPVAHPPHPADERVVEALRAIAVGKLTASDAAYVAKTALSATEGR